MERFNGRISKILRTTHLDGGDDLDSMLWHRNRVYNHYIPQWALCHIAPVHAPKRSQREKPNFSRDMVCEKSGLGSFIKHKNCEGAKKRVYQ